MLVMQKLGIEAGQWWSREFGVSVLLSKRRPFLSFGSGKCGCPCVNSERTLDNLDIPPYAVSHCDVFNTGNASCASCTSNVGCTSYAECTTNAGCTAMLSATIPGAPMAGAPTVDQLTKCGCQPDKKCARIALTCRTHGRIGIVLHPTSGVLSSSTSRSFHPPECVCHLKLWEGWVRRIDQPFFPAVTELAKRGLLSPETWQCNRPRQP